MKFTVGNKVVYPSQGLCRVGTVIKKVVAGRPATFYRFILLDAKGGELFVPLDRAGSLRIRQLIDKSAIPELLNQLKIKRPVDRNWKQRTKENTQLLASGSAFDLVRVIQSLTGLNTATALSPQDRQILDRARRILIAEISEVTGTTRIAAEEQVDNAIAAVSDD